MKPEDFGKWLESWVKDREKPATMAAEPKPTGKDWEWLTISWGLIR